jgi:hypothetical protein
VRFALRDGLAEAANLKANSRLGEPLVTPAFAPTASPSGAPMRSPEPGRPGCFGAADAPARLPGSRFRHVLASHHADARLPNDYGAPSADDVAQRAGPVDLPAIRHGLPREARAIVRNDLIADHSEAAHLEFGRKLRGCHGNSPCPVTHVEFTPLMPRRLFEISQGQCEAMAAFAEGGR